MPDVVEKKITVLIVDDHTIVRQGLRTLLELMDDLAVVGEAGNGKKAVELAAQLKPDVILMDLVMPELDGISATRQICALGMKTKVIALTSFLEDEKVILAIQAGAFGFLLKDVSPDELVDTIRAAYLGEARLHPNVARLLMKQVAAQPAAAAADLTAREIEVLLQIARGMSNRQISEALFISEKTVKTHVSSLLDKLDLDDRTQLAIYAIKNGLAPES
jgi:two-component system, NarL family, response regulator LiaR